MKMRRFISRAAGTALSIVLMMSLSACGGTAVDSTATVSESVSEDTGSESENVVSENTEAGSENIDTESPADETGSFKAAEADDDTVVRIGSLKGPTTMGLVNLMKASENGETGVNYEFTMETQADVIAGGIIKGELDVAFVPANLASVIYSKTDGGVTALNINTTGVLECITGDEGIASVKDLAGKTVYTTGQGSTPEYSLRFLLDQNGVKDCNIEFLSEATEVAAKLSEDAELIAVLPQPFATVAIQQNEGVKKAFSLADEWDKLGVDSKLITGVTIVRNDFLSEHEELVKAFISEQGESASMALSDVPGTAELVAEYGIIEKAPIAEKALPSCGIACITGQEMKSALQGYLQILNAADATSIGGGLPADKFYYVPVEN